MHPFNFLIWVDNFKFSRKEASSKFPIFGTFIIVCIYYTKIIICQIYSYI